jgi:dephospho-CoA kinase
MKDQLKKTGKFIVGLTGTFGSGKSTVSHLFQELGAFIIDADQLAHEALEAGNEAYNKIAALFKEACSADGARMDRKKLAKLIFSDAKKRKQLEEIIHPYVLDRIIEEVSDAEEPVVIIEVPLLFEAGFDALCDQSIVVIAKYEVINKRLIEKGFTLEEIEKRNKAQMPLEEKMKRANYQIENSGSLDSTRREVEKVWNGLRPVLKGDK